ncbi:MAG: hypothetical protein CV087_16485 [Candidatus Brocadia sp. WS118]|nr:MAG: hypothetical protein CV087_16485 [Candidatus Brocadia sp. WS118]
MYVTKYFEIFRLTLSGVKTLTGLTREFHASPACRADRDFVFSGSSVSGYFNHKRMKINRK